MKNEFSHDASIQGVVVASGGLDSCVTAAIAAQKGPVAMFHVQYGQRTENREKRAFNDIADALNVKRRLIIRMDHLSSIGGSSLTDRMLQVPTEGIDQNRIPNTYVPFRNANLLAAAVSWAEVLGAHTVYIGINETDSSGYPDCRKAFLDAFNELIRWGTKPETDIRVEAPLLSMDKAQIVKTGIRLNAPIEKSWSCYTHSETACGICDSCRLRLKGFNEAGVKDPIPYFTGF